MPMVFHDGVGLIASLAYDVTSVGAKGENEIKKIIIQHLGEYLFNTEVSLSSRHYCSNFPLM